MSWETVLQIVVLIFITTACVMAIIALKGEYNNEEAFVRTVGRYPDDKGDKK